MTKIKTNIFYFKTRDKLKIYAKTWTPPGKISKVICLIHGLGEHSGRYEDLAKFFCSIGYGVAAFDRRGSGLSKGKRGHIPNINIMMDDITRFLGEVEKSFGKDKEIILYGHSLGGNLVLNYGLRKKSKIKKIISSGPALTLPFIPKLWQRLLGRTANILRPSFSTNAKLNLNKLSHDPDITTQYLEDPLNHYKISARTFCITLDTGRWLIENANKLTIPTLIMHGTDDYLTNYKGSVEFAKNAGNICDIKLWEGFYHEIHNEVGKEKVFKYIEKWLGKAP